MTTHAVPTPLTGGRHSDRVLYGSMLASSLASLVASFVLSVDAVTLAADPTADLSCDINAVLSCGTVGTAWQSSALGFPNAFLGLMAEPVVITICVAALGGVRFPRWFMASAHAVYAVGLAFAWWLFLQAYLVIGALCPWCLLVTVSTTGVFASLTHLNIRDGNLPVSPRTQEALRSAVAAGVDVLALAAVLLALALAIVLRYGDVLLA